MNASRKPYSPPAIVRHFGGNERMERRLQAGHGGRNDVCERIDGVPVAELAARFGSPLYVFSERTLREKIRVAREAFESRYPDTRFAWSYKTNYLNAVCAVFHSEGSLAEVVSDFEYEKARHNGVPGRDIIYNGPNKTRESLERAVSEGAMIQVDNWDELLLLDSIAESRGQGIDIALRCWLDAGIQPVWSKFGFGLEAGGAWRAVNRIAESRGRLRLQGLHTHIGTYILEPNAYRVATEKLVTLMERCRETFGWRLRFLNLGGGFPSLSSLHYSFQPPEHVVPPIETYADAITGVLLTLPREHRPRLYLETGRALVDEAGHLITTVVAVRQTNDMRQAPTLASKHSKGAAMPVENVSGTAYVVDAGVNLLYTGAWFRFNVKPARAQQLMRQPTRVVGCLCMNIDVLRENALLPPQATGDHLVFHPVGAYNITQSMQFITYRPAVVMIDLAGRVEIIREREDLDYVQRLEHVPEHLSRPS
ncbi:MAG: hypothetical protein R3F13_07455 [Prosthecobacter sp.]